MNDPENPYQSPRSTADADKPDSTSVWTYLFLTFAAFVLLAGIAIVLFGLVGTVIW